MEGTKSQSIDVLVVGAGPVGLAATLFYACKGHKVVLAEHYGLTATAKRRAFNERHQQVGLNPESITFLKKYFPDLWQEVHASSCDDGEWITIAIFTLQNIFYKYIKAMKEVTVLFSSQVEIAHVPSPGKNARVIVSQEDDQTGSDHIFSFYPELVVICDGKHDGTGVAKKIFDFYPASRVTLSSSGIIGMIRRYDHPGKKCLHNRSIDSYPTSIGPVHVRLLGSLQERYIALGAGNEQVQHAMEKLTPDKIKDILIDVFHEFRDSNEPDITDFTEFSQRPIPIILDYRKETIKLFDNSNTIVSVEGDAARKTTFFSGSGLNSAWKGLEVLFSFCAKYKDLVFGSTNLLHIDEALLEKDQGSLSVSMELLKKGSKFVVAPQCVSCNLSH